MIASGFSYSPKSEKQKEEYNTYRSIYMVDFALGLNAAVQISKWNIFTQNWLKYYTQMRLMDRTLPRNKIQVMPMLVSFAMSSIWHGIEVGYHLFFLSLFINALAAKLITQSKLAH